MESFDESSVADCKAMRSCG